MRITRIACDLNHTSSSSRQEPLPLSLSTIVSSSFWRRFGLFLAVERAAISLCRARRSTSFIQPGSAQGSPGGESVHLADDQRVLAAQWGTPRRGHIGPDLRRGGSEGFWEVCGGWNHGYIWSFSRAYRSLHGITSRCAIPLSNVDKVVLFWCWNAASC